MSAVSMVLIRVVFATWCLTNAGDPSASRRTRAAFAFGAVWFTVRAAVSIMDGAA